MSVAGGIGGHCGISSAHVVVPCELLSKLYRQMSSCSSTEHFPALPSPMSFPAASGCLKFPRQCPINQIPEHMEHGGRAHTRLCSVFTLIDVLLHFSIQFLIFTAPTRAPSKLRDFFVNPLQTKVASVRPEEEHARTSVLHSGNCFGFYQKVLILKIKKVTDCLEGQQLHYWISLYLPLSPSLLVLFLFYS